MERAAEEAHQPGGRLSAVLHAALEGNADNPLTFGGLLNCMGDRSFGILIALLAIPTLIPILPPGTGAAIGAVFALLGLEMLLGLKRPWFPRRIEAIVLSHRVTYALKLKGVPLAMRFERWVQPRWRVLTSPTADRAVAGVIVLIGLILFLPIPFLNSAPGVAMLLLGLGMANEDGLFVGFGLMASAAIIAFVALSVMGLVRAAEGMT